MAADAREQRKTIWAAGIRSGGSRSQWPTACVPTGRRIATKTIAARTWIRRETLNQARMSRRDSSGGSRRPRPIDQAKNRAIEPRRTPLNVVMKKKIAPTAPNTP